MNNKKNGFSLIEMAIVLLISSFVLASFIRLVPTVIKITRNNENTKKLRLIQDAISAYIIDNKKLPKPTQMKLKSSDSCYATSETTCATDEFVGGDRHLLIGGIPALDLNIGVSEILDSYGTKFIYVVNEACTNSIFDCSKNSSELISVNFGNDNVVKNNGYVVISTGPDKINAVDKDGKTIKGNDKAKNSYSYLLKSSDNVVYNRYGDDKLIYNNMEILKATLLMNIDCKKPKTDDEITKIQKLIYNNCDDMDSGMSDTAMKEMFNSFSEIHYGFSRIINSYEKSNDGARILKDCVLQCSQYGELKAFSYIKQIIYTQSN